MTLEEAKQLPPDSKVVFIPEGKTYDFGYISDLGYVIIYEPGERNGQDSYAVEPAMIEETNDKGSYRDDIHR